MPKSDDSLLSTLLAILKKNGYAVTKSGPLVRIAMTNTTNENECQTCRLERMGCACDGSFDAGCWLCTPGTFERPECTCVERPAAHNSEPPELPTEWPDGYGATGGAGFWHGDVYLRTWHVGSEHERCEIVGDDATALAFARLMAERDDLRGRCEGIQPLPRVAQKEKDADASPDTGVEFRQWQEDPANAGLAQECNGHVVAFVSGRGVVAKGRGLADCVAAYKELGLEGIDTVGYFSA